MTVEIICEGASSPAEIAEMGRMGELARGSSHQPFVFDPKGDPELVQANQLLTQGQMADGE